MSAPAEASPQQLLAAMLNKTLFVALRTPLDLARMPDHLQAHLHWAIAAERRGELFASGPFVVDGTPPGSQGGMTIVRAGSIDEARRILQGDPFVSEGLVSIDLRRWSLMEGSVTVTLRFSDQTGQLL